MKNEKLIKQTRSTQLTIMRTLLLEFSFMVYLNVFEHFTILFCAIKFDKGLMNLASSFELWT